MNFSYPANVETDEQKFIQTNKWSMETLASELTLDEKIVRLLDVLRLKAMLGVPDKIWPYEKTFNKVKTDVLDLIKILPSDNLNVKSYKTGVAGSAFTFGMNCLVASLPTTQPQVSLPVNNPVQFTHSVNNNDADNEREGADTPPSKRVKFNN